MSAPDVIRRDIAETRKLTNRPFGVNLFVLETPQPTPQQTTRALELLQPIREELGLTAEPPITKYCEDFNLQFEALLEGRPAITGPIRRAAAKANRPEFMSLWAGQGVSMCREMPAAELMTALIRETDAALKTAHISVWH